MITLKELTRGVPPDAEQLANLLHLKKRLNVIRRKWNKPMIVTSGLRSKESHEAIYRKLGKKAPAGSAHLSGQAADIYDREGALAVFVLDNLGLLEKLGLYIEDPSCTRNWIHFQTRRPASGRRIFIP